MHSKRVMGLAIGIALLVVGAAWSALGLRERLLREDDEVLLTGGLAGP